MVHAAKFACISHHQRVPQHSTTAPIVVVVVVIARKLQKENRRKVSIVFREKIKYHPDNLNTKLKNKHFFCVFRFIDMIDRTR